MEVGFFLFPAVREEIHVCGRGRTCFALFETEQSGAVNNLPVAKETTRGAVGQVPVGYFFETLGVETDIFHQACVVCASPGRALIATFKQNKAIRIKT